MNQITIYELLPLLRPGFVAMDKDGTWYWFRRKPRIRDVFWAAHPEDYRTDLDMFLIDPVDDWKDSLMECGNANNL